MPSQTSSSSATTATANTKPTSAPARTPPAAASSTSSKLIALLAFYDERPDWLAGTIASLSKWGIDHIVALDGAYFLFPDGRAQSSTFQHLALLETAHDLDIGLTLMLPQERWLGNEVEKRTALFRHADLISTPGQDWYLIWDADQFALGTHDLKHELARTTLDAAEITVEQPELTGDISRFTIRGLFRAIHGITVTTNHYTYAAPDGRILWGKHHQGTGGPEPVPSHDLSHIACEHRTTQRPLTRRQHADAYYNRRDQLGIELAQCEHCRQEKATEPNISQMTGRYWPRARQFEAIDRDVCKPCRERIEATNRAIVKAQGLNPDTLVREHLPA